MYWRLWDKEGATEFEKDTLIKEESGYERYKNITLYASWTKNAGITEEPVKETVKEIESTGETKANIEFENEINKNYKLDIQKVEVNTELANKNVKFIADINVLDGNNIVKISDTKMKIKIALPEELKGYSKYEVVYILNGEIKETLPATIEEGYLVFETTHLSEYGVIAKNIENEGGQTNTSNNEEKINNPKTGDNIRAVIALFTIATMGLVATIKIRKR